VSKDSLRVEACGSVDELSALIGVVRSHALPETVDSILQLIQDRLFLVGAELAAPDESGSKRAGIDENAVRSLEDEIDRMEEQLPPLRQFILPGGSPAGAGLHMARAVARRAERHCVSLSRLEKIDPVILRYLNRLSDLCFVLARHVNRLQSAEERRPGFISNINK
jgi:cob(I)alamin adenosyltransferase